MTCPRLILFLLLALLPVFGCQKSAEKSAAFGPAPPGDAAPIAPLPSVHLVDKAKEAGLTVYHWRIDGPRPMTLKQSVGNGCAFLDYDGDGNLDVLLVGQPVALFRGDGKGGFADVSAATGIHALKGDFRGVAVGDYDNDGHPDLYLTAYHGGELLHNEAGKSFRDVSKTAGIAPQPWGTSAIFTDIDNDGRLDLYICNYVDFGPKTTPQYCFEGPNKSVKTACAPTSYNPLPGVLYRNDGNSFSDRTADFGLDRVRGGALGVAAGRCAEGDMPCLKIANDERPGELFVSRAGGGVARWQNVAPFAGVALDSTGRMHAGMGVDWGDYDGDGKMDLFVATFEHEIKNVYQNGAGGFTDRSEALGVQAPLFLRVAFGAKWADFNNDGWLDLILASGHVHDNIGAIDSAQTFRQPADVLISQGGTHFTPIPLDLPPLLGRGLAVGDYDNDGKSDALIVDSEGVPVLLHNETPGAGNSLTLRLIGKKSAQDGYGAVALATLSDGRTLRRECQTGGSYMSASSPLIIFGVGTGRVIDLTVRWPSGIVQTIAVPADSKRLTIQEL